MRRQVLALVCGVMFMVPAVSAGQSGPGNAGGGPPNGPLTTDRWWMPDGFDAVSVTIHVNRLDTPPQTGGVPGPPTVLDPPPVQGLLGFGGEASTIPQQSFVCVADCDEPVRSIPEPGIVLLLGGGLAGLAVRRRRAGFRLR